MEVKIPKIIHYCWFGGAPKPQSFIDCMASWTQVMPDYQLMCWDEKNSPIAECAFAQKAFDLKKWAFVSDYVRLYALYNYGGIYLDIDVIVYKRFDYFLQHAAFSGIEFHPDLFYRSMKKNKMTGLGIATSVMGSIPSHPLVKICLDYYKDKHFEATERYMCDMVNTRIIPELFCPYGFQYIPVYQQLEYDFHIYPPDVFSSVAPVSLVKYASHLCANTWRGVCQPHQWKRFILDKIIGQDNWSKIRKYVKKEK